MLGDTVIKVKHYHLKNRIPVQEQFTAEDFDYEKLREETKTYIDNAYDMVFGDAPNSDDALQTIKEIMAQNDFLIEIDNDDEFTVREASALWDMSQGYIRLLINRGKVKRKKLINGGIRITGKEIKLYYYGTLAIRRGFERETRNEFLTDNTELTKCSVSQAAHFLNRDQAYVRQLLQAGIIEGHKPSNFWIVDIESLKRFANGDAEVKYNTDSVVHQFRGKAEDLYEHFPLLEEAMIEGDITIIMSISSKAQTKLFERLGLLASRRYAQTQVPLRGLLKD